MMGFIETAESSQSAETEAATTRVTAIADQAAMAADMSAVAKIIKEGKAILAGIIADAPKLPAAGVSAVKTEAAAIGAEVEAIATQSSNATSVFDVLHTDYRKAVNTLAESVAASARVSELKSVLSLATDPDVVRILKAQVAESAMRERDSARATGEAAQRCRAAGAQIAAAKARCAGHLAAAQLALGRCVARAKEARAR
jgi:hypothetical protein